MYDSASTVSTSNTGSAPVAPSRIRRSCSLADDGNNTSASSNVGFDMWTRACGTRSISTGSEPMWSWWACVTTTWSTGRSCKRWKGGSEARPS